MVRWRGSGLTTGLQNLERPNCESLENRVKQGHRSDLIGGDLSVLREVGNSKKHKGRLISTYWVNMINVLRDHPALTYRGHMAKMIPLREAILDANTMEKTW
jgi:hypothetical protein